MHDSDSGIGIDSGTSIFLDGIGIELNSIGPESELNWNRLLPELHISGCKAEDQGSQV